MKELESELAVLRNQLSEVSAENKLLRTLQHRQDRALKKFEGAKGQLPQLIQSHSEEVRALKAKCKKANIQHRGLEKRLRSREMELRALQEQNQHLQQLSKDRSLGERESLREEVNALKTMLQHMELQFQEVARRKAIEQRMHQQRIQQEMNLNKELKKSLLRAEQNINELKTLLLENEINIDTEKNPNPSKSPKEVRKLVIPSQRLPLIGQQHQLEAVEGIKESNLSSMKKLTNFRQKPCTSVVFNGIKSGVASKEALAIGETKSTQFDGGETECIHEKISQRNTNITIGDDEKSKLEDSEVNCEEGVDGIKKEKLLKALKAIDIEESIDINSNDNAENVSELFLNMHISSTRKMSHNFGKEKLNSERSCSSGPSSAKSKKSPTLRKSAKPDLMHDLFGTIPKSEYKLNRKKTSDPAIPMFSDVQL
ncbi:lebercilin-like protein [Hetaerina americana]|uniref:lebercilin-like protein n=1 Tax=Hetaerina americana TaxID=62018 RepID=UPI003A7F53EA